MTSNSTGKEKEISHETLSFFCEKIAFWLNELFWSESMEPLAFYYSSMEWINQNAKEYKDDWAILFVPFPEQTIRLLKDGNECQVVATNSQRPFSPLLTMGEEGERMTYFVEDLTVEVEKVKPLLFDF